MERMFPEFTQQPGKIELSGHIINKLFTHVSKANLKPLI